MAFKHSQSHIWKICFPLILCLILSTVSPGQDSALPNPATAPNVATPQSGETDTADTGKEAVGAESTAIEDVVSGGDPSKTAESSESGDIFSAINESLKPVDSWFGTVNGYVGGIIFFPIPLGGDNKIDFAVLVLVLGAAFFTIRMGFISIRGFTHSIHVIAGKYDDSNSTGDVSHFQALTTALSATVGLGNIAGVTTAIAIGGPGAAFWMVLAGFLG